MFSKDMAETKESQVNPTVIVQPQMESKPRISPTKKYVIIGVISVLLIGLVLTGILVGMHIFTQAQKDLVQFTLKMSGDRSQEVTSDPTNNIVKFHVQDTNHEAWVINDFNTDIKITKIKSDSGVNCYLTPLNRTTAMLPSKVIKPENTEVGDNARKDSLVYTVSGEPVSDISFLNKEARTMCKGISTYWMYPMCGNGQLPPSNTAKSVSKREAPYYVLSDVTYNNVTYPCINGCCLTVCACKIDYTYSYSNGTMHCEWMAYHCCAGTNYCYYSQYCDPTPGLDCDSGNGTCSK